ncbi:MAG TPA: hypothetical protein VFS60_03345, partial [Thermoanaerobaculia bacterium]|nr:hypothetical protein [Thermoanaerobaculia bacterium]
MKRLAASFVVIGVGAAAASATAGGAVFRDLPAESVAALPARPATSNPPLPRHFRALEVDVAALESQLALAPPEGSAAAATAPLVLTLPYPDGSDHSFRVEESSILEPELQAKFPELRTFVAQGIDDPSATARLSLTALGFHAMVLSTSGTVLVDPYARWDTRYALSYWKRDGRAAPGTPFRCEVGGADGEE